MGNPAWVASGPQPDDKKQPAPQVFVATSALTYVEALRRLRALEAKLLANRFLFQKTPNDKPQLATQVAVTLPDEILNAKGPLTKELAEQYAPECKLTVQYDAQHLEIEYGSYEGHSGIKLTSAARPAASKEELIAQYKSLLGAAIAMTQELHGKNSKFKLVLMGEAPKYDKLPFADLKKAAEEVCAANNIFAANLWGVEWENKEFKSGLSADIDSEKEQEPAAASIRLRR